MKIVIIGTGRMGGWFARELSANSDNLVAVYDNDKSRLSGFDKCQILNNVSDIKSFEPEFLINAVGIRHTISVFKSIESYIPKNCIISDIASVKSEIPSYYASCGFRFASCHPMFGPTFANVERLSEENTIIIKESDAVGRDFFRNFFASKSLNIFDYTFDEHDQMIAYSLTLPFASTMVFSACMDKTAVPGTTFKKHINIAKGVLSEDDFLLADILFNKYSVKEIEKVTSRLEFLKHVIGSKDYDEAVKFFDGLRKNLGFK